MKPGSEAGRPAPRSFFFLTSVFFFFVFTKSDKTNRSHTDQNLNSSVPSGSCTQRLTAVTDAHQRKLLLEQEPPHRVRIRSHRRLSSRFLAEARLIFYIEVSSLRCAKTNYAHIVDGTTASTHANLGRSTERALRQQWWRGYFPFWPKSWRLTGLAGAPSTKELPKTIAIPLGPPLISSPL